MEPWPRERIVNPGVPGLQETLLYHFVPARLQSGQLETHVAQTLRTFEGKDVYVESFRGRTSIPARPSPLVVCHIISSS